ncbi:MAG: thermonuclease family protein [Bacteroidetes bacterium]|nr:thermonuclease family protein [Bacteroidota bacterium]
MKKLINGLIILAWLGMQIQDVYGQRIEKNKTYKVIAIQDGDTYDILVDKTTMRIRMDGIDAPEKGMPFYKVAKQFLASMCFGKMLRIEVKSTDRHGRTVARAFLSDGRDLSQEMLRAGLAWHFVKYSKDKTLASLELAARKQQVGIWSNPNPMSPWENRRLHRKG